MTNKKKLLIGLVAAIAVVILIVLLLGQEPPMYAVPGASNGNAREAVSYTHLTLPTMAVV